MMTRSNDEKGLSVHHWYRDLWYRDLSDFLHAVLTPGGPDKYEPF